MYLTSGMMAKSAVSIQISHIDNVLDEANIEQYFAVRHRGISTSRCGISGFLPAQPS
jgi:hypothetical protein